MIGTIIVCAAVLLAVGIFTSRMENGAWSPETHSFVEERPFGCVNSFLTFAVAAAIVGVLYLVCTTFSK